MNAFFMFDSFNSNPKAAAQGFQSPIGDQGYSPIACVISFTFSGDYENYIFLETSEYNKSENP